ncbi:MAG: FtsQ-type POTRA domain-containing protein [Nitrospinota bacterium]
MRPAIGFLVFVEILLLGGHAVRWARTSSRFVLRDVVLEGHRALDPRDIARQTALAPGLNIFDVDLEQVRSRVAAHPWIRRVNVRRELPHALRVELEERRPAALLRLDPPFGVDAEGVVLGALLEKPGGCLPLLEGFDPLKLAPGSSIAGFGFEAQLAAVTLLSQAPGAAGGCPSVRRTGDGRLRLRLLEGRVELLASEDGLEGQAARLRAVLPHVLREPPVSAERIELDLTFPGRVVVRPIGQDGGAKG